MKGVLQMKISTMALFFGGALVLSSAGVGLAACSSDSGTGTPTGGNDSGGNADSTSHTDGAMQGDTGMTGDTGMMGDGGTGAECGTTPSLHPSDGGPGSVYCPFGPDGGSIHCDPGANQICCINPKVNGAFPPSTCSTTCPYADAGGATNLECEDKITCTANNKGAVCCGSGPMPALDTACGYYSEKGLKGGACAATCAANEFELCATSAECSGGKTCTPFKAKGMQLGYCM